MNKPLGKIFATLLLTVAATITARAAAAAEALKPAVTIAFAGYDQLAADAAALDKLSSHLGLAGKLKDCVKVLTKGKNLAGLDKSRPWGLIVALKDSDDPIIEGYLPVTDLKKFIENIPMPGGETLTPNSDGIYEIPVWGKSFYVKQKESWAVISDSVETLAAAQADPTPQFSDLVKKYLVAVRANVQNVPADRREILLAAVRNLVETGMAVQGGNEDQQAFFRSLAKVSLEKLDKLKTDGDFVIAGLGMDAESKSLFIDMETRAIEGSDMAAKFAAMKDAKSDFAGFALPGAAITVLMSTKSDDAEAAQARELVERFKLAIAKELDNNDEMQKRALAKQFLQDAADVLEKTIDLKKKEFGMAVVLEDGPAFVAGAKIAAGDQLDAALKKLVKEIAADQPDFGRLIKFDAEEYEGVKFHVAQIPVPASDRDSRDIFGDSVEVVLGLSESRLYFGAGKNPIESLKKAIAASKKEPGKSIEPLEMALSAEKIAKFFAKAIPERQPTDAEAKKQAAKFAEQLAKAPGQDRVTLTMKPVPNGGLLRLSVDPAVTKTIMEMIAKSMNMAGTDDN